ncbi:TRAFAC clade GTPase domain-containing protein [Clostridium botulinum]|uniref:TRAFAC clade GTPase domain-containing protein n=2 Tax=Clostridium botulinum TaxID=1491 RepID=UPI0013F0A0A6|nr:hypothetical protein [Clostridium botulinum]MBN1063620.1 hypothetical protein [Clostridium botulinum]MBY6949430.1 hypothetical protein [Clostridium botulinum]MBY7023073.1 hypothetical protein [Clostridium botulinum]NFF23865.1 hypothetical protein [Clostridium botulinum]NFF35968.1 hypothetical protein [Clostridium botulinum]
MDEELVNEKEEMEENYIVNLPLGEALSIEDTYSITSKERTKLIVLAGPSECGKTTLITTVYQLFHRGPIEELFFAQSQTIKGFEQRSYHTRANSGMDNPNTQRTRIGILDSFLHLKLWNSKNQETHNFLLTDFSGEDFNNARANVEVMKEDFSLIGRADFLIILIDGDSITKKDERFSAIQITQELLTTIINADLLKSNTKIYFVISKNDIVKRRCDEDPLLNNFVKGIPDKLKSKFSYIKNEINFYNVAAMPKDTDIVPIGYGINELIKKWTQEVVISSNTSYVDQKDLKSEFNKFSKKVLEGGNYE